jgi:hypothetical protein
VEGDSRAPDPPPSSSSRSGCSWPTPEARACLQRRRRRPPGRASLPGVGLDRVRPLQRSRFALLARWLAEPLVARWCNHETSAAAIEREFGPSVPYGWISEAHALRLAPKPEFCIGPQDGSRRARCRRRRPTAFSSRDFRQEPWTDHLQQRREHAARSRQEGTEPVPRNSRHGRRCAGCRASLHRRFG